MARYDARQLLENIEQLLHRGPEARVTDPRRGGDDAPSATDLAPSWETLERSSLPPMRQAQAVDRPPHGARLGLLKKVLYRLLRPVGGPQAVFNHHSLAALELLAHQWDQLRRAATGIEARQVELGARLETLHALLEELRPILERSLDERDKALARELALTSAECTARAEETEALIGSLREEMDSMAAAEARQTADEIAAVRDEMLELSRAAADALTEARDHFDGSVAKALDDAASVARGLSAADARQASLARKLEETIRDQAILEQHLVSRLRVSADGQAQLIAQATERIRALEAEFEGFREESRAILQQSLSDVRGGLASVEADLQARSAAIDSLEEAVRSLGEADGKLGDGVEDLRARIEGDLQGRLAGLEAAGTEAALKLDAVREELVGGIAARLESAESAIEAAGREFDSARVALEAGDQAIQGTVQEFHAELDGRISGVTERLEEIVEGSIRKELDQLIGRVGEASAVAAEQALRLAAAEEEARTHYDNIHGLWAANEERKADVSAVGKQVQATAEALRTGLEEPMGRLDGLGATLEALQQRTSRAEEGLREVRGRLVVATEQQARLLARAAGDGGTAPKPHVADIPPTTPMDPADAELLELSYLRFQRQYRGDADSIRELQQPYVELIGGLLGKRPKKAPPIRLLDVACGEGVFLDLARAAGWEAEGVDLNEAMASQGRESGLTIHTSDAIAFLEQADEETWDAITAFQFVEHLPLAVLVRLTRLCYRALRPGGVVVFETLNPSTLLAHKWYHADPTHERMVFPGMIQILLETAGFRHEETRPVHEPAPWERLEEAGDEPAAARNAGKLNQLVYGPQDYWIAARKPK